VRTVADWKCLFLDKCIYLYSIKPARLLFSLYPDNHPRKSSCPHALRYTARCVALRCVATEGTCWNYPGVVGTRHASGNAARRLDFVTCGRLSKLMANFALAYLT